MLVIDIFVGLIDIMTPPLSTSTPTLVRSKPKKKGDGHKVHSKTGGLKRGRAEEKKKVFHVVKFNKHSKVETPLAVLISKHLESIESDEGSSRFRDVLDASELS